MYIHTYILYTHAHTYYIHTHIHTHTPYILTHMHICTHTHARTHTHAHTHTQTHTHSHSTIPITTAAAAAAAAAAATTTTTTTTSCKVVNRKTDTGNISRALETDRPAKHFNGNNCLRKMVHVPRTGKGRAVLCKKKLPFEAPQKLTFTLSKKFRAHRQISIPRLK